MSEAVMNRPADGQAHAPLSDTRLAAPLDVPADFMAEVLKPYRDNAKYLQSAQITRFETLPAREGGKSPAVVATGRGRFSIPESCYIDDTGHFNAVELLICYNQLMYSSLAIAIDQQLHSSLAGWSIEDFWSRQLPSILIYRTAATYRSPIDSTNMRARFTITEAKTSAAERGILKLATHVEFTDGKGLAYANIDLALVDLPEAAIEALTAAASPDDADSNG